jgi:hypothetical protein
MRTSSYLPEQHEGWAVYGMSHLGSHTHVSGKTIVIITTSICGITKGIMPRHILLSESRRFIPFSLNYAAVLPF